MPFESNNNYGYFLRPHFPFSVNKLDIKLVILSLNTLYFLKSYLELFRIDLYVFKNRHTINRYVLIVDSLLHILITMMCILTLP